jgi:NADPH-dependent glutamate synthase beta subunit-like oxidoreductase
MAATTVSGVGAANMVLRDLGKEEYRPREFSRDHIRLVKGKPWTPAPDRSQPITPDLAARVARECQLCEDAPCVEACPTSIDVLNFARRIEAGNFGGAARSIRDVNPFSEICGLICPAERLCEKVCRRLESSDSPVRIADLHGWVCKQVTKSEGWDRRVTDRNGLRVGVVGAGPAGLSCAHFLARRGYRVDILDKADRPGGILSRAVPLFHLPGAVVQRDLDGIALPGMEFHFGTALGEDLGIPDLEREYDATFLAPGLWSGRSLQLPGLERARATDALSFLQRHRQQSDLAVGSNVLIIGGGSVASDTALTARRAGAAKVHLVCLEEREGMPALAAEIAEMEREGIAIQNGWGPCEVSAGPKLSFARCRSVFGEDGEFRPAFDTSETMGLEFDQLIMAIGQAVEPALARHFEESIGVEMPIQVDEQNMQIPGRPSLFAGGDIIRGAGTAVEAVRDGRRAAVAIDSRLREESGS